MKNFIPLFLLYGILCSSCKKNEDDATPNPCANVTINITVLTGVTSGPGATDGSITITGPVGTGFLYKKGNDNYTSSTFFGGLAAGLYNITVRNAEGCTATKQVTIL